MAYLRMKVLMNVMMVFVPNLVGRSRIDRKAVLSMGSEVAPDLPSGLYSSPNRLLIGQLGGSPNRLLIGQLGGSPNRLLIGQLGGSPNRLLIGQLVAVLIGF